MSQLSIIIIAGILILYVHQVWLNKSKPITGIYFYMQLISSVALLFLIWLNNEQAMIEYKILLTVMAVISLIQCLLSYKKQRKTTR